MTRVWGSKAESTEVKMIGTCQSEEDPESDHTWEGSGDR